MFSYAAQRPPGRPALARTSIQVSESRMWLGAGPSCTCLESRVAMSVVLPSRCCLRRLAGTRRPYSRQLVDGLTLGHPALTGALVLRATAGLTACRAISSTLVASRRGLGGVRPADWPLSGSRFLTLQRDFVMFMVAGRLVVGGDWPGRGFGAGGATTDRRPARRWQGLRRTSSQRPQRPARRPGPDARARG